MKIIARNHDDTIFATDSGGTLNNQTIYYPADSDQIFGACDCLRFRNQHQPCENLALIAVRVIFAANTG